MSWSGTWTSLAQDVLLNLLGSLVVFAIGYLVGNWRVRRKLRGRNLEQYDFYPFLADQDGFPQFSVELFERGVAHLLRHPDANAAGQLIVIGEQNGVRYLLSATALAVSNRASAM